MAAYGFIYNYIAFKENLLFSVLKPCIYAEIHGNSDFFLDLDVSPTKIMFSIEDTVFQKIDFLIF